MVTKAKINKIIEEVSLQEYGENFLDYMLLLKETAAAESGYGKTDPENIMRIDKAGEDYVVKNYPDKLREYGIDPEKYDIKDLKTNIVFAMLNYKANKSIKGKGQIVTAPPNTKENRADMWKAQYNTLAGKGTREHYLENVKTIQPITRGRIDELINEFNTSSPEDNL